MAKSSLANIPPEQLPTHIGIIMDGNGRWAKKRGLPRNVGHRQGAQIFEKIAKYCREIGIRYLTAYAFSTENWKRPQDEVDTITDMMRRYLKEAFQHPDENIRLCFLGDLRRMPQDIQEMMSEIAEKSADRTGITVNIAVNYGGRDEIVHAARKLAQSCLDGKLSPEQIDEGCFANQLYTAGQPDPDLIIRPSGELRLSNFLLWQAAYAEFVFLNVLWPDFSPADLDEAILQYLHRSRRFGGI